MAKANVFRDQSLEELTASCKALYEKLFKLRNEFGSSAGRPERAHRMKDTRRELARALTILRERQLLEEKS